MRGVRGVTRVTLNCLSPYDHTKIPSICYHFAKPHFLFHWQLVRPFLDIRVCDLMFGTLKYCDFLISERYGPSPSPSKANKLNLNFINCSIFCLRVLRHQDDQYTYVALPVYMYQIWDLHTQTFSDSLTAPRLLIGFKSIPRQTCHANHSVTFFTTSCRTSLPHAGQRFWSFSFSSLITLWLGMNDC